MAHTLNLCVVDAISSTLQLQEILKKCRTLVGHFKKNVVASEQLKNMQQQMGLPQLKLKQDVATRWNSSLIMMERLIQVKNPLSAVLVSLKTAPESLNSEEWNLMEECVEVLKPAEYMTSELSGSKYPTMSIVIPLVRGLQLSIKNTKCSSATAKQFQTVFLNVVSKRLGMLEDNK